MPQPVARPISNEDAHRALIHVRRIANLRDSLVSALIPERMTVAQYGALDVIANSEQPLTISQIAGFMHVCQPTMSSTVRKLEAKGCVSVEPAPSDRRAKFVKLTPKGEDQRLACDRAISALLNDIAESLESKDWAALQPVMARLADRFEAAVAGLPELSARRRR